MDFTEEQEKTKNEGLASTNAQLQSSSSTPTTNVQLQPTSNIPSTDVQFQPSISTPTQETTIDEKTKETNLNDDTKNNFEESINNTSELSDVKTPLQTTDNYEDLTNSSKEIESKMASNNNEITNKEITSNDVMEIKEASTSNLIQESTQSKLPNIFEGKAQEPSNIKQETITNVERIEGEVVQANIQEKLEEIRGDNVEEMKEMKPNTNNEVKQETIENIVEKPSKQDSSISLITQVRPITFVQEPLGLKPLEQESNVLNSLEQEPTTSIPIQQDFNALDKEESIASNILAPEINELKPSTQESNLESIHDSKSIVQDLVEEQKPIGIFNIDFYMIIALLYIRII